MDSDQNKEYGTLGGAVIQYMDGTSAEFRFTRDDSDVGVMASRMETIMKTGMLCMRLEDGRLTLIPTHNIRRIDIKPAPPSLPDGVVYDVREI